MLTTDQRDRLQAMLAHGCGIPAARDHATLILRLADEREVRRLRREWCESGCSAPVVTQPHEPPLCAECAGRMLP